ncbi:hypothetical protein [Helicobacter pullorum]|uniref:restriction endonuclease subunit S n=1 Tax=Helicobacter pullorum TaxID=35818 RepID=UPI00242A42BD|nr:hypothetical protein [Helicobacter pullorum]
MLDNQTLQDKYPHLEVSVLTLSEVKKDNESFRIDSEYLKQEYLYLKNILLQKPHKYLSQLVSYNSRYSQPIYDDKSKMKVINSQYIRNEFIDYENAKTGYGKVVPKESVLINSTGIGTLGRVNINLLDFDFSIDSHINVLVVKDRAIMNPCFLMIFLQTKYGQSQINRHYSGTSGQIEIYPKDFNCFLIPLLPMSFQLEIEKLVKDSHKALESSKVLYKEAENLLYESLGLDSKNPLQSILESKITDYHNLQGKSCDDKALSPNYTIATLKESFLKTGRLDAEYYQSKYEDIERFIKSYGYITLQDLEIQDKNYTPKQEKQYHYIELANIGSNGNISTPTQDFGKNLPTRARRIVKEGDVIISSVEGSLSSCALITKEFDSCLVSTGFYVLRSKHINGETLLVLFKSEIFQDYLKKFPSGTILSAISKEELQNILIPKIDSTTQIQIATYIQKSFELRAEAKKLLESAKAEVESTLNNANNGGGGGKTLLKQIKAKLKESKRFYRLAQWLLIETMCFNDVDFTPCDKANILDLQVWSSATHLRHEFDKSNSHNDKIASPNYTIRTLANSLKESGRLDAEYYQSKYEKNEALLKSLPHKRLHELVDIYKSIEPGSDFYKEKGLPFVRVSNLSKFGVGKSEVYLDSKDFAKESLQSLYPKKDDVLLSKDGSVGIAYAVENDLECVLSGAILRLKIKDKVEIKAKYLSLVLNALTTQLQAQRDCGGSIIAHWRLEEIQNLLIPLLDSKTQEAIESKISQSFALKARSKELLESAKQRVENAIHENQ